ncbi:MAG: rhomboid family intramembrane serine protease [Planctomycetota bacterium]
MLIIPIGRDQELRRTPFVTIGLVVLLALIHVYTGSVVSKQVEEHAAAQAEYAMLIAQLDTTWNKHQDLDISSMDLPAVGGDMFASMRALNDYQQQRVIKIEAAMERGLIHPEGSDEHDQWLAVKQRVADTEAAVLFHRVGFTPAEPSLWTMLTSMFFHGDLLHLLGNLVFLWAAGCLMESAWGHLAYAGAYLVAGILAIVAHWFMLPTSTEPCIGASGAIAGMMGACLVVHHSERIHVFWVYVLGFRVRHGVGAMPAYLLLGLWLFGQLFYAFAFQGLEHAAGIAFWAHIGGFVGGAALALLIRAAGLEHRDRDDQVAFATEPPPPNDRAAPAAAPHAATPPPLDDAEDAPETVGQAPATLGEPVQRASAAYARGDRKEAHTILEYHLRHAGPMPEAHVLMANLLIDEGQLDRAAEHGSQAIIEFAERGDGLGALDMLRSLAAADVEPRIDATQQFQLAGLLEKVGELEGAAELYHGVASAFPDDPFAAKSGLKAGTLLERLGATEDAQQCYRLVIEIAGDPVFADTAQENLDRLAAAPTAGD